MASKFEKNVELQLNFGNKIRKMFHMNCTYVLTGVCKALTMVLLIPLTFAE